MIFDQAPVDRKVRVFTLSPSFIDQYVGQQPTWGYGGLGQFTYKRCVDVSTPVLCDDLQWRPAGDLQVGQGLVGFDADVAKGQGKFRHLRHGVVLHNKVEKAQTFGVELEDGTTLYATPDHEWLVRLSETNNRLSWKETKDLAETTKGGAIHLLRPFGPVWGRDLSFEGGYLAAAYDGEGCLDRHNGVQFIQVGNAMLDQVRQFLAQKGVPFTQSERRKIKGRQQVFVLRTSGRQNFYRLLGRFQPKRLLGKFRERLLSKGGGALRTSPDDYIRVIRVFDAGERNIAVLSTSTETHFTGGFASHNTYARPTCACADPGKCGHPTEEWWQTCKRVVEGVYNIQKIHCRTFHLPWTDSRAQKSAQEMFKRMWEFKFLPPGRGLWMMGTDVVYARGGASLNNCFGGDTEVITSYGVRKIRDLAGAKGNPTLLTTGGKWVEAPVRSFGKQKLFKLWLSRQGVDKVIYCTGDHRWFARDRRQVTRDKGFVEFKTTELRPEVHHLQYVFGLGIKGNVKPSPFGVAHGFTYGDGRSVPGERNANAAMLVGEKDAVLQPYFALCPQTEKPELGLEVRALPNFFRELPPLTENKSYLLGWLMGYFAADGTVKSDGCAKIDSTDRKNVEFVRDVCVMLGIGTYSIREDTRESNLTGRDHTMYSMSLMRDTLPDEFFLIPQHRENFLAHGGEEVGRRNWTVKHIEETDRVEEVFCATVEGYGAFALEGNILTGNCGFTSTENIDTEFANPFCFLMDMSMLGVGVGGDCRGRGKVKLEVPRMTDEPWVVEDSREGWVELIRCVLNSFVSKGSYPAVMDFSLVRKRGAPLKTFGGTSSGPRPLISLVENLTKLLLPKGVSVTFSGWDADEVGGPVLRTQFLVTGTGAPRGVETSKITSAQIVDIFNYIGKAVVAGGIRRTAEIMFGEPDDQDFVTLKQDPVALDDRRWASNNSIWGTVGMEYSTIAESIAKNGEPGIIWMDNARAYSRMNGVADWKDERAKGANPCSEQTLENSELCCLVETFPAHHTDMEDYKKTLKTAYLYAKTVTLVPTHDPRTNAVLMRNRRIGCSMSGIQQAKKKFGRRPFLNMCETGYTYIQELDKLYSEWLCIPRSIKTTSVKPSGTVSLLAGATPGIHYPHSEFYIRNIRVENTSPLVTAARAAGYQVEKDTYADDTSVVSFPVKEENYLKGKRDVTIWEQFADAAAMQRHWADNQVSCTVTFTPEEARAGQIAGCLSTYEDQLKAISLLPLDDHGYTQAPYIEITEAEYYQRMAEIKPMDLSQSRNEQVDKFCDGGKCEISFGPK